jgi:hypothetical protein
MQRLLLTLMVAGALLLSFGIAQATPPTPATGEVTVLSEDTTSFRQAGGNTLVTLARTGVNSGDIVGDFTQNLNAVLHPSGEINFNGTETCACTVDGQSGTLVFRLQGKQDYQGGPFRGEIVILSGTGDLANLHGQGTFTGAGAGSSTTYEMWLHFDP